MSVRALVLRTAGTNCDAETQFAWEKAGAKAERVHINRLIEEPKRLARYQILTIPGGFSYGDDISAGKIFANQLVHHLADVLHTFLEADRLVLGICNGFQVLVKCGLLPGSDNGRVSLIQQATLTSNDSGLFEDRWTRLRADTDRCVFLEKGESLYLPVAHAEGKFVPADSAPVDKLEAAGQVALRYVGPDGQPGAGYPWNPNGSVGDVAGLCDPTGRILGLMPHPERHLLPWHHPQWTRHPPAEAGDGFRVFQRAVAYFK
ncbi:MAG TPA: phosphoribosylformylglycinamidine synthase I [Phycisphaerae bacterium]|nr:phosphoribosylformylglycinamidine synthase I [Phycisphaerae bacterium]